MNVTSRSAAETYEKCPKRFYWGYKWQGRGLERTGLNLDLTTGIHTHRILGELLLMLKARVYSDPAFTAMQDIELAGFAKQIRERGLAMELSQGYEQDEQGNIQVQEGDLEFIIELYSAWMRQITALWAAMKAPALVQEYAIISVEEEFEDYQLIPGHTLFVMRPDAVLKRHSDGELFVLNFKTVGSPNAWWLEGWRHDQQTLSEVLPIEAKLGQKVSGVLIEGLVKGAKRTEYPWKSGRWYLNSPLVWGWKREGAPPFPPEWAAKYEYQTDGVNHRLGKGFRRVPVWNDPTMGARQWLTKLYQEEQPLLMQQLISLPPILRADYEVERWRQAAIFRELKIQEDLTAIEYIRNTTGEQVAMAEVERRFPMHTANQNCIAPSRCPFYDCCWGMAGHEPLENGYQLRQFNHPSEEQALVQVQEAGQ